MNRTKAFVIAIATGSVVALVVVLALVGAWPFDGASGNAQGGRHVVWEGRVALKEGSLYMLDTAPVVALSKCAPCLQIEADAQGERLLGAPNGIQGWPKAGTPSYADCVQLRNKLTLSAVTLDATHTSLQAVAPHGWICATGGNAGLMRLQYDGRRAGRFVFSLTNWGVPSEG